MYPLKLNTYLIVFGLRRVFHIGDEFGSDLFAQIENENVAVCSHARRFCIY